MEQQGWFLVKNKCHSYILDSGKHKIDSKECKKAAVKAIQENPQFVQFVKNAFPNRWEKLKEELHADGVKIAGEDD